MEKILRGADDLAARILKYLKAHPNACDSADGIRQWWLEGTGATLDEVSAALDRLVAEGRVERIQRDSREVFRRVIQSR
jgi:hypothetical protein